MKHQILSTLKNIVFIKNIRNPTDIYKKYYANLQNNLVISNIENTLLEFIFELPRASAHGEILDSKWL
jgi:hypothetical protein